MRWIAAIAAIACAVAAGGCASGGDDDVATAPPPSETLFVVGSGPSTGDELRDPLREAWPRIVYEEAFPVSAVLVNAANGPSSARDAIAEQVPLARELAPEVVAVWIGSYDLSQDVAPDAFGAAMAELLGDLRDAGAMRVLVADLPSLPAYAEDARVGYNAEIAAAADATGSTLVSIADETLEPVDAEHDYQPDAAGHRVIADAFVAALVPEGAG